jgi:D-tyrosyl-tRNA(Tyr) deacylase
MRAVVQRVSRAEVRIGGRVAGKIGRGFVVLIGVARTDSEADAAELADRILGMRVFADSAGKMNLALGALGSGGGCTSTFSRSFGAAMLKSKPVNSAL